MVQALGELGHPDAAPVLAWLLSDPDVRLAQRSGDALVQLGPAGVRALLQAGDGPAARVAAGSLAIARLQKAPQVAGVELPGPRAGSPDREPGRQLAGEPGSPR